MANDALKRGWPSRVAWGIAVSALLHAAVLVVVPSWETRAPTSAPRSTLDPLVLTALREAPGTASADVQESTPEPVRAAPVASAPLEPTAGAEDAGLGATAFAAMWERVAGGDSFAPSLTVAEPRPSGDAGSTAEREDSTPSILDGSDMPVPTSLLPEFEDLALDRLSVVRPELALSDLSFDVLLRNPLEIDAFIKRTYDAGEIEREAVGLVSVALWIDERGAVRWAEIDHSSGSTAMDEVALAVFREVANFRPARNEGMPVSRSAIFWIRFPWGTGSGTFLSRGP